MNDDTREVHDLICPRCPYRVRGLWPQQLADLEVELHAEWHADHDSEMGLICDPPCLPAPRVRDLTLEGLTRAALRALWGWAK